MLMVNTNNQAALLGKLSILFVEDDSEVREHMARYLSRRIGKIYTAHSGEAGLDSFKESHPDLVISDIRMGGMNGLEMCRAIREIDPDLPVIFISAHNESEILLSSIDLGVTKFMVKPVDTDLLMDTINDVAQSINEQHILEDRLQQINETDFESESVVNYISHFLDADRHDEFSFVRHFSIPKHGINGDFYSLAKHNGDVYVMLADGAGHGLAAVIPALPLPAIFQKQAMRGFSLLSMAAEINRTLHEQHLSEHFVATTLVRLNADEGFVEILNCGNPPAFIIADDGRLLHTAHSKSTALGMIGSQEFYPEVERVSIEQDARIYLFTDGLVDTFFSSSADSGDSELYSLFEPGQTEDVFTSIANRLEHAIQERNVDDVTLLEVRFEAGKQPTIKPATQPKPESACETETAVELGQLTLLYVEDDDLTREYLTAFLNRRMGMVYVAKNGEEGLAQFIQYRPQIVIADIKMPLMNGLVMAEEIRKLDKDVPIIVTSGSDNAEDAEKMFEMGISRFHLKPLDPGKLTQTVQACIRQSNTLSQLRRAASAFDASSLAAVTVDHNKQIISANPAFSHITGYSLTEIMGQSPSLLSPGRHDVGIFHAMWNALEESGSWSGELLCQHKNGTTVPAWLTVNSVMSGGVLQGYNFIFSDITERQKNEEKLLQLTMHDGLTHLPNRSMFENRLNEQLVQVKQNYGKLAIICINLDRFIEINNTLGVRVGDEVLLTVAQRLLNSAVGVDVVCRMGGDEFAVLMLGDSERQAVERAVVELSQIIRQPIQINQHEVLLRASFGISMYPSDGETYEELLKSASSAMNQSRQMGGDTYRFFDKINSQLEERRVNLQQGVRAGLMNKEFYMLYQPKYSIGQQRVVGAEALVRWKHPAYGVISPAEFIPLAESNGAVIDMSEWIIDTVCAQIAEWQQKGLAQVPVSINISPVHFWRGDLIKSLQKGLEKWDIPPAMLPIEVTEGLVMDTSERTLHVLGQLKALGFHLSIDDFGTGYSSLKYLRDLPISELKIDRSFIIAIPEEGEMDDPSRTAIPRAIIQLASEFNLTVVAEGVETENQKNFLLENGCDVIQGYLFSKPVAAPEFALLCRESWSLADLKGGVR